MNDQSFGSVSRLNFAIPAMLFSAATNMQHCSGFHMDIRRMLWAAIESPVCGPAN
jgi:hypothetical protein